MYEELITKIDELISVTKAASIPIEVRWLDAVGVGSLLCQEPRYVLERFACRPDFPKANRVGQPRWKASEVLEWMENTRDNRSKPGRKRLPP